MKRKWFFKYFGPAALVALVVLFSSLLPFRAAAENARVNPDPQTDPATSLSRGRALLKQGHADQALGLLETALKDYTQARNARGIAACEDALGDLYLVQGQYKVSLDHYQKAYQAYAPGRAGDGGSEARANTE